MTFVNLSKMLLGAQREPTDVELMTLIGDKVAALSDDIVVPDKFCGSFAATFGLARLWHEPVLKRLVGDMHKQLPSGVDDEAMARLLLALATFARPVPAAFLDAVVKTLPTFFAKSMVAVHVIRVAWAMAVFDVRLDGRCLDAVTLGLARVGAFLAEPHYQLLYDVFLHVYGDLGRVPTPLLSIAAHCFALRSKRSNRRPVPIAFAAVVAVLHEMSLPFTSAARVGSTAYRADFVLERHRVAIFTDDPCRCAVGTRHLLGHDVVCERHLRRLGWHVVRYPYWDFAVGADLLKADLARAIAAARDDDEQQQEDDDDA